MRDRIRGVYGQVDPDNLWVRAGRTARDLNYLRFMGGVVASSIPDVARIVMAHGITKVFKAGLVLLNQEDLLCNSGLEYHLCLL
jgi:hypothetical protein